MDNIESTEVVENISTQEVQDTSKQEEKVAIVEPEFDKLARIDETKPLKKTEKSDKNKDVAVFSKGNLYKHGLGEIEKGYTILPAAKAKAWIEAAPHKVREATPQEVAKQYLGE